MFLRCKVCHRRHFRPRRRCRQVLDRLVDQVVEAVAQRQDGNSETWAVLVDATKHSYLVQKRGLSHQDVLYRIYEEILLQWYERADTDTFARCRPHLDQFACQARIEGPTGLKHDDYRQLYLLSWLQRVGPGPIPPMFLANSNQSCYQFQPVVATTGRGWQMVMRECSTHRLLLATATFWVLLGGWTDIPVPMLLDKLIPAGSPWPTYVMLSIVFILFFTHMYRGTVVLDAGGVCSGPLVWKRYVRWEDVSKVWTWRRNCWLRLTSEWWWFQASKRDRRWLEKALPQFVRRAHVADLKYPS